MSSPVLRYEIRPSATYSDRFFVVKLKGRLDLGCIASGLSRQDAVLFKRTKEAQSAKLSKQRTVKNRVEAANKQYTVAREPDRDDRVLRLVLGA